MKTNLTRTMAVIAIFILLAGTMSSRVTPVSAGSSSPVPPLIVTVTSAADDGAGSLREALDLVSPGGTIVFSPTLAGSKIRLASTLDIAKVVTIDGFTSGSRITVSGDTDNDGVGDVRVFYVGALYASISNMIVEKGLADSDSGGALYNDGGALYLDNVLFQNNQAEWGSAIYSYGELSIVNCTFKSNAALTSGSIYNQGALTVENSVFTSNTAGWGSAIYNEFGSVDVQDSDFTGNLSETSATLYNSDGTVHISGGSFVNNSADWGAALYNYIGTMTISYVEISGNTSVYNGGGIYNEDNLSVIGSVISNNDSGGKGGGIANQLGGTVNVNHSSILGNYTSIHGGGGIYNAGTFHIFTSLISDNSTDGGTCGQNCTFDGSGGGILNDGALEVNSSLLAGNAAAYYGGGISNAGNVIIQNSTLYGNAAGFFGGGASNNGGGVLNIFNGAFSANTATHGGSIDVADGELNFSNTILANSGAGGECYLTGASNLGTNVNNLVEDNSCSPMLSGDPKLGALADNGGSTQTLALLPGSPAIDAGDDLSCLPVDQRGVARPLGEHCDIGAYEALMLPGTFGKVLPLNITVNQPTDIALSWQASAYATDYEYCYDTTNDNACADWVSNGPFTSVDLFGLDPATTYYWQVRAINSNGVEYANGSATAFWSFRTLSYPGPFNKYSPVNGAVAQQPHLLLTWGESAAATEYEYCYDTIDNQTCDTGWIPTSEKSALLLWLDYNATYYWHVRSINAVGETYSNGSDGAWWSFTVVIDRPYNLYPGNPIPAPADDIFTRRPEFIWDPVPGATGYIIEVARSTYCQTFNTKVVNATSVKPWYTPTVDLTANASYCWRVRATGPNGPSAYSQIYIFTTGNPPSVPTLIMPANNAVVSGTLTPLFDWSNSSVPTGTVFDSYEIQIATDSDFFVLVADEFIYGVPASSWTPYFDLDPATLYYWRVRSWNTNGDFSGWATRSFKTGYAGPSLLSPVYGIKVGSLRPTFTWSAVLGATSYKIQVSLYSNFSSTLVNAIAGGSSYTPGVNLPMKKTLYWRVQALGFYGPGTWSLVWKFTTP